MTPDETLEVGEERTAKIFARQFWNDTGIHVHEGERYLLHADGTWRDLLITSGPDGYETPCYSLGQRVAVGWRRVPDARWFALIGAVRDGESRPFVVGRGCEATMSATGSLQFFANDVPRFYWNNFGSVWLSAKRLA